VLWVVVVVVPIGGATGVKVRSVRVVVVVVLGSGPQAASSVAVATNAAVRAGRIVKRVMVVLLSVG
jgi:hypothetical protein